MGLRNDVMSPCENTWTGRHTAKCGHDMPPQLKWALLTTKTPSLPMDVYVVADNIRLIYADQHWSLSDPEGNDTRDIGGLVDPQI